MKKAFTLIELLVVIAIIAILAAILFPVFSQAKMAAKKTQSISNLKNLATATIMYAGDNDDYAPRTMETSSGLPLSIGYWTNFQFQAAINPYIKNGTGGVNASGQANSRSSIWFDPSDPDKDQPAMMMSYLTNGNLTVLPVSLSNLGDSSQTVYMTLRQRDWSRAVGVLIPSPLPVNNSNDPFWVSEYFDTCFDPWSDTANTTDPYYWTKGNVPPPCSLFPSTANCSDWNSMVDGQWNPALHGLPRRRDIAQRYAGGVPIAFADGHAKVTPFERTYVSEADNMWDVR